MFASPQQAALALRVNSRRKFPVRGRTKGTLFRKLNSPWRQRDPKLKQRTRNTKNKNAKEKRKCQLPPGRVCHHLPTPGSAVPFHSLPPDGEQLACPSFGTRLLRTLLPCLIVHIDTLTAGFSFYISRKIPHKFADDHYEVTAGAARRVSWCRVRASLPAQPWEGTWGVWGRGSPFGWLSLLGPIREEVACCVF